MRYIENVNAIRILNIILQTLPYQIERQTNKQNSSIQNDLTHTLILSR